MTYTTLKRNANSNYMSKNCEITFKKIGKTNVPIDYAIKAEELAKKKYSQTRDIEQAAAEGYSYLIENNYSRLVSLPQFTDWINDLIFTPRNIKEADIKIEKGKGRTDELKTKIAFLLNTDSKLLDDKSRADIGAIKKNLMTSEEPISHSRAINLLNALEAVVTANNANNAASNIKTRATQNLTKSLGDSFKDFPILHRFLSMDVTTVSNGNFGRYVAILNSLAISNKVDAGTIDALIPR